MFLNQLLLFFALYPINVIFQTLRREWCHQWGTVSPLCLLLSKQGLSPLTPLPLHSGKVLCNCGPRTLALSPTACVQNTNEGVGGGVQSETSAGNTSYNLLNGCSPCTLWEDCMAELWPAAALLSGYRQAACCLHRKPFLYMQVIPFHEQLFLW